MIGLNVPSATSIADLRSAGNADKPREQVWGLSWHSSTPFVGLAYCVGGRSLYWGGWSPRLLDSEIHAGDQAANGWPQAVANDLKNRYFDEAGRQIGVDETNDFIFGPLQNALRRQLFDGLKGGQVADAIDLTSLPNPQVVQTLGPSPTIPDLLALSRISWIC
jgi:choline dehydrogenase-like flavoprotein